MNNQKIQNINKAQTVSNAVFGICLSICNDPKDRKRLLETKKAFNGLLNAQKKLLKKA